MFAEIQNASLKTYCKFLFFVLDEHSVIGVVKYWLIDSDSDLLACQVLLFGLVVTESLETTGTFPRPGPVHSVLNTMCAWKTFCLGGHSYDMDVSPMFTVFFPHFDFCLVNKNWVVVSNIFYFHHHLGKIPILTNIFQVGWNRQLEKPVLFWTDLPSF